jgi:hypothetical protein
VGAEEHHGNYFINQHAESFSLKQKTSWNLATEKLKQNDLFKWMPGTRSTNRAVPGITPVTPFFANLKFDNTDALVAMSKLTAKLTAK